MPQDREGVRAHAPDVPAPEDGPTVSHDLVTMLDLLTQTIVSALGFGVAVINIAPPLALTAFSISPRQASTVSTALTVGSIFTEWPTMSALAKFTIITSKVPSSVALTTACAIPAALISGFRS